MGRCASIIKEFLPEKKVLEGRDPGWLLCAENQKLSCGLGYGENVSERQRNEGRNDWKERYRMDRS